MSYEYAIVSPKSDKQAANLLVISLGICTLFVVCVVTPVVYFRGAKILSFLSMDGLVPVHWLIPLMVWLLATFQALNYWNTRTKHFMRLSVARLIGAITGTGGSLGFGFTGFSTGSHMVAAQAGGQAISTMVLGQQIFRDNGRFIGQSFSWRRVKLLLAHYEDFPRYYMWSNLTNNIATQLPIILLGIFFSAGAVGFYSLALRILQAPMGLIGAAISQVFHEKAANALHSGQLKDGTLSAFTRLTSIGLFPILLFGIFSADIFSLVFGREWLEAGVYAGLLAPYVAARFISSPLSVLSAVLEKQGVAFWFSFTWLSVGVLSFFIGVYVDSVDLAVGIYATASGALFLARTFLYHSWAGISVVETGVPLIKPIIAAVLVFLLHVFLKNHFSNELFYLLLFFGCLAVWSLFVSRKIFQKKNKFLRYTRKRHVGADS